MAGSSTAEAADEAGVDVVAGKVHARTTAEDRDEQRQPLSRRARKRCAEAIREPAGATSAWTSTSSGRLPSSVAATATPGAPSDSRLEEGRAGIGDLAQAVGGHLEDADLLGRAEAVLARAQQAQAGEALAFERQHHVDEVLERLGPGELPSLVTWPTRTTGTPFSLA